MHPRKWIQLSRRMLSWWIFWQWWRRIVAGRTEVAAATANEALLQMHRASSLVREKKKKNNEATNRAGQLSWQTCGTGDNFFPLRSLRLASFFFFVLVWRCFSCDVCFRSLCVATQRVGLDCMHSSESSRRLHAGGEWRRSSALHFSLPL